MDSLTHNRYTAFMLKPEPKQLHGGRVCVFIDASNLWSVQKSKKCALDYAKLLTALTNIFHAERIRVYYYAAYPAEGTRNYNLDGKHKFFTFLQKGLKFIVRKKPLKRIIIHGTEGDITQEKGNMDVEMTIDIIHLQNEYDTAVLLTGDSDFLAVISYIKNLGKKAYVFSSKNSVSNELRTGCSGYFDLLLLEEDIWGSALRHRTQTSE